MEEVLQRIEQKIDAMQGDLTTVKGDLTTVKGDLTTVKGDLTTVKGDLTTVTHEVMSLKGGLAAVQSRLGAVEGGLSALTETVHQQGLRHEYLIDKVTITMEGVHGVRQVLDERFDEVLKQLDQRVQPVELATRYLATKDTKPR